MRPEDAMIDPVIAAELDAIDATLAGERVDPAHAELAELALLVASGREEPRPEFARMLEARVDRRFATPAGPRKPGKTWNARRPWWSRTWTLGVAGGALSAVVVVAVALSAGGGGSRPQMPTVAAVQASKAPGALRSAAPATAVPRPTTPATTASGASGAAAGTQTSAVSPPPNGRKIIQSASLNLGTGANHVDDVAQGIFTVVGSVNGIVDRSTVTATGGPDGNAQFELRIPSAALQRAMSELSRIANAHVISRTDNSQDVNQTYVATQRRLADATALRASLLKQLQNATTQAQIDSLKAQIHDAEGAIGAARGDLARLDSQINYSQVSLTVQADSTGATVGGGFSIGKAAHDALRVLTVAAGVALIVLAVAVPVGLLVAFWWWVAASLRRRRRDQALDLA